MTHSHGLKSEVSKKYRGLYWDRAGIWTIAFILNWRIALVVYILLGLYDSYKENQLKKEQERNSSQR